MLFFSTLITNRILRLKLLGLGISVLSLGLGIHAALNTNLLLIWSQCFLFLMLVIMQSVSLYIHYKNTTEYNTNFEFGLSKLQSITTFTMAGILIAYFGCILFGTITKLVRPSPLKNLEIAIVTNFIFISLNAFALDRWYELGKKQISTEINQQKKSYIERIEYKALLIPALATAYFLPQSWVPPVLDIIASLMICIINIHKALDAGKRSSFELLDKALTETMQLIILKSLSKHFDSYKQYHGQETRETSGLKFIKLFLEFDKNKTMNEIFQDTKKLEHELEDAISNSHFCIVPTDTKSNKTINEDS